MRIRIHGVSVTVEFLRGDIRHGVPSPAHYGYVEAVDGEQVGLSADAEHVDVFVGPLLSSLGALVIDQGTPLGDFDEHKIVLGCSDAIDALRLYESAYHNPPTTLSTTFVTMAVLKNWLKTQGAFLKPFTEAQHLHVVPVRRSETLRAYCRVCVGVRVYAIDDSGRATCKTCGRYKSI